jgi:hypothetical protein
MHLKPIRFSLPIIVIFALFCVLIAASCTVETKLGRQFADSAPNISILIMEPDIILLNNITKSKDDSAKSTELFPFDVDRGAVTAIFTEALKNELRSYGLKVYSSARLDTFLTLSPPAYLFNTAQLEMEAFMYHFKDKLPTDSVVYTQDLLLNAVNFNTWFEFTELNATEAPEVLFSNFHIKDAINGDFKVNLLSGDVTYAYTRKDIASADMATLAAYAGKTNGAYIFNHLLNKYLRKQLPDNTPEGLFYFYDKNKSKVLVLENYVEFRKVN